MAGSDPARLTSRSWRALLEGLEVGEGSIRGTPMPVDLTTVYKPVDLRAKPAGRAVKHNLPAYRFLSDKPFLGANDEVLRLRDVDAAINWLLDRPQDHLRAEAVALLLRSIEPSVRARPVLLAPGREAARVFPPSASNPVSIRAGASARSICAPNPRSPVT